MSHENQSLMRALLRRRPAFEDRPRAPRRTDHLPPPHDLGAERATLSAALLDAGAAEILPPSDDFFDPVNRLVASAIAALVERRDKVDAVSVAAWLRDREVLHKVGGSPYIGQLADETPAVAHADQHAEIVRIKARRRRVIADCERFAAEGRGDVGDEQQWIASVEAALFEHAQPPNRRESVAIRDVLKAAFEQITAAAERGDRIVGTPTGYTRLDDKTAGMVDGDLWIVAARPGMGKAQPLDALVLTPSGWRTMGSLQVGDVIAGAWGLPQTVVGVFPQGVKALWSVRVTGGRRTRACDEHLWWAAVAQAADSRRPSPRVYTTAQLREALLEGLEVLLPVSPAANSGGWPDWQSVERIQPAGEAECQCIAVDSPRHLYVTDDFIVTHNTSFVMNVAANVASPRTVRAPATQEREAHDVYRPGLGVCVFSLEMPREQLATRMACSEGRVDLGRVRQGQLHASDWQKLTESASYLSSLPIWIDDTPALSVLEVRAKVRRTQAEYNREATGTQPARRVGLVVVDYLQLMQGSGFTTSREQEISEISRGLKGLAKELKVPVVALSQLNRAVETRSTKDKRPQLSDLRESGAIEQDADTIVFITRPEYYDPDTDLKGIAELDVAKQRNGPTGRIRLRFSASCTRFDNLEPGDYPELGDE